MTIIPETLPEIPLPILCLSPEGQSLAANAAFAALVPDLQGVGVAVEALFAEQTAEELRALARGAALPEATVPVWLRTGGEAELPMAARLLREGTALMLYLMPLEPRVLEVSGELVERVEILSQMIGAARDACWCIDFEEPVDLGRGEEEIVDQVFRNAARWRACNDAMAALYGVPEGQDFNTQPVGRYFPETTVNRAMIRELVRSGYRLDGAQAIDQRHDGTEMLVENDFRALIRDGALIRLWGTTRDIGPSRAREQRISAEAEAMRDILGAVPDPILVLSGTGVVLAANPAAEHALGPAQLLGTAFDTAIATRHAFDQVSRAALEEGGAEVELVPQGAAGRSAWVFHVARMPDDPRRYVLSARRKARRRRRAGAEAVS